METNLTFSFVVMAVITVAGAIASITLRNLVHCALALAITLSGLGALYLQLEAQFVGFAQILVYVGAVAILIVFAILLTRSPNDEQGRLFSRNWRSGLIVAAVLFGVLGGILLQSKLLDRPLPERTSTPVRDIGVQLMTQYILPLEVLGVLLTAAVIGAVILARPERKSQ